MEYYPTVMILVIYGKRDDSASLDSNLVVPVLAPYRRRRVGAYELYIQRAYAAVVVVLEDGVVDS